MVDDSGMRPPRSRRSCLAVPGSSDRMIDKAVGLDADEVILDLEDSVALTQKEDARQRVVAALRERDWGRRVRAVRVNDVSTPWTLRDLLTVVGGAGDRLDTIILPKVRDAGQVAFVDHVITQLERDHGWPVGGIGLELQVEDAEGLLELRPVLAASPRVEAIVFGPGDMAAALGMPGMTVGDDIEDYPGDPWHHVLFTILLEARRHGIQAIDGPYARIRDADGFDRMARRTRALGFDGKWVLHPDQIEPANRIFGVSQAAFERASDLLDAYRHATEAEGRGAATFDGEMIDEATRKMAEVSLARGRAQGLTVRPVPDEVAFDERAAWRQHQG